MPDQTGRILHIQSPLGEKRCAVTALTGYERLNDLYTFDLTLVADGGPISADELLGEDVTLTIEHADIKRKAHGVVCEFMEIHPSGDNVFEYRVLVVPRLWLLGLSSHNRLFEEMDAVAIVKQVVSEGCQMPVESVSLKTYRKRELCCQFGETDLAFVTRLLAEEGIAFGFKHTEGDVKLMLSGGMEGFPTCSPVSYPYNERDASPWKQRVSRFRQAGRLCTGKLVSTDYSEYAPSDPVKVEVKSAVSPKRLRPGEMALHGQHDFERSGAGRALPKSSCTDQAKRWLAGVEAGGEEFVGESGAPSFMAGCKMELEDKPVCCDQTQFLLTEVNHYATEGFDQEAMYSNSFRCVATSNSMAFTPPAPLERRRMWGPQTARVVDIDDPGAHAQVKVQFPWNTQQNSCWTRVVQLYAGNQWGSYFVPDVGQEVLVEFLNGDPDRPVVVGAVYNDDHPMPQYTKTQSGIKTRSGDYNELRFDDAAGAEEVYFQAGRDHNFLVQNDEKGEVQRDQTLEVGNEQSLKVGSDRGINVGGSQRVDVTGNLDYEVGRKIVIEAGTEIEMSAGMSITLKVGGSKVVVDNTGVTIEGTMITVNGNASTEVTASGILTMRGGITRIN